MCEQARVLSEFAATGEGTVGSAPCLHRGGEALQEKSHTRWWRVTRHHALRGSSLTGAGDVRGDDDFYAPVPISVSLQGSSAALPQEEVERMPQPLSTFRSSRSSSSSLDQLEEHSSLDQPEEHRKGSYESLDEPEVDYSDGEQATGSTGSSLVDVSRSSSAGAQHPERPRRDGSPIYANFPPLPSPSSPPQPSPEDQPLRFLSDHWAEYDARHVGRKYYYNFRTGQRSWKPPRRRNEAPRPPLATVHQPPESQRTVVVLSSASPPASRRKGPPPLPPAKKPGLSHKGSLSLPRDSLQEKTVQHNGNSTFYYGRGANVPFQPASEKVAFRFLSLPSFSSVNMLHSLHVPTFFEQHALNCRGILRGIGSQFCVASKKPCCTGARSSDVTQRTAGAPEPPPGAPRRSAHSRGARHAAAQRLRRQAPPELRPNQHHSPRKDAVFFFCVCVCPVISKIKIIPRLKKKKKKRGPLFFFFFVKSDFLSRCGAGGGPRLPARCVDARFALRRFAPGLQTRWVSEGVSVCHQDGRVFQELSGEDQLVRARMSHCGLGGEQGFGDIPSSVPEESPSHQSAPQPPPEATPPQATSSKWGKKPSRSKSIKQHQQAARSPPLSCDAAASALDSGGGGPPSPQERKNRIRDKLRHFFVRRPTLESLQEKGIFKDEPVFGCNLAHLCERDRSSVPRFVRECILEIERRDMTADGLYRASGNLSQVQKVRCHVNQDDYSVLALEEDIHVLTGALKMFFRHMKEPLFPFNLFNKVLRAVGQPTRAARLAAFRDLLGELPRQNYDTLKYLLRHLLRVTEHSDQNRMHVQNLAIVFGPTLLSSGEEPRNLALDMMQQNQIIEFLLLEYSFLFL
ncbi:unnamed protein product [Ixodes pacificus]